ncbi:MAG: hypothetical protein GPJ54_19510 [Candidatus Heimdallarchaeota archaeon]|nr:hypothetical protein [Candidatus Heimdallarchaeota archaeon]
MVSPAFITGNSGLSQIHNNDEASSVQSIQLTELSINNNLGNEISSNIIITDKISTQSEEFLINRKSTNPPFLPLKVEDSLDSENELISYGSSGGPIIPTVSETPAPPNGCINPSNDFLIVDHGQIKSHFFANNFTYQTISEEDFGSITAEEIMEYRMLLLEPNWVNYTALWSGLNSVAQALNQSSCLVAALRIGNENKGTRVDIDLLGTDYDDTNWHDAESIVDGGSDFITGTPWNGITLGVPEFNTWSYTDVGVLLNTPTTQQGYNVILDDGNPTNNPTMFEYQYGQGHVIVDSLSSLNGGWGLGNTDVANNYIQYMNYTSYQNQIPIVVDNPGNLTYNEFTTGNTLTWQAYDSDPDIYKIIADDLQKDSGIWTNTESIVYDIDGFSKGIHNITIEFQDKLGHKSVYTSFVTVQDGTPPSFQSNPTDLTIATSSWNNELEWNLTDDESPDVYLLYEDNVLVDFGPWSNSQLITYNIDHLSIGAHNVTIFAIDLAENVAINTVLITVVDDSTAPSFTSTPGNIFYEEGVTGNTLKWRATDSFPYFYQLFVNEVEFNVAPWLDGVDLSFDIDGLGLGIYNFTVRLFDTSGSSVTDTSFVIVEDTIKPSIQSSSGGLTYELGSSGNIIDWTVTDTHPENYLLLVNNSNFDFGSWESDVLFEINVDNLSVGVYNLTIILSDSSSNIRTDTVFVSVQDTTIPVINTPTNQTVEIGSSSNTINWIISDLDPINYVVYRNGSEYSSGLWSSGLEVNINVDGLSLGNHIFIMQAFDVSGNSINDTVQVVVVDSLDPVINKPTDIAYEYGSTLNQIIWIGTDDDPDIYSVVRNDTLLSVAAWTSGNSILIGIDGLSPGVYNYTITLFDAANNQVTDTLIVTVRDTVVPDITQPSNIQYEFGSTGNKISWNGSDLLPLSYGILVNGSSSQTGGWATNISIEINIDNLDPGIYNYTIVIYDTASNFNFNTVILTVVDSTPPEFTTTPEAVSYSNGTIGNTLIWVATDLDPDTYTLFRESTIIESGFWVSSGIILINIDGLAIGEYNYTILVSDSSGNSISNEVIVTVTSEAVFTSVPRDLHYTNDTSENTLSWIMEDSSPDSYIIYRNTTEINSGVWTSGIPIIINIDNLVIGYHNFSIWVNDTDGNIITDEVKVFVTDNPVISTPPSNITYVEGTIGHSIVWNATDSLPDNYTVYKDGAFNSTGVWSNGVNVVISINGLFKGVYNFTIVFTDESGNTKTDTLFVTVNDSAQPIVDAPDDVIYEEEITSNTISWTGTDLHPHMYNVTLDGGLYDSGTWISVVPIIVNIDGLPFGAYTFTIYLNDTSNNVSSDTVIVTVTDSLNPEIDQPSTITYEEDSSPNTITWTGTDNNPHKFNVTLDGSNYQSGTWTSGNPIVIDIDGLSVGSYIFVIRLNDTSNNFITHMVIVSVTDTVSPGTNDVSNFSYEEGSSPNIISWTGTDNNPDKYNVTLDGSNYQSGTWISGNTLIINIDGLSIGIYQFVIYFNDTSGNLISDQVTVTVVDTTSPIIDSPGDTGYSEGSTPNTITWTGSVESNEDKYFVTANGSLIASGSWTSGVGITVNIDDLVLGVHFIVITLNDTSNNIITDEVKITVFDDTKPSVTTPSNFSYSIGSTSNSITWTGTDTNPDSYVVELEESLYVSGTWVSNNPIIIDVDGLGIGIFNFTIILNDTSNNIEIHTVLVTVNDTAGPGITSPTDIAFDVDNNPKPVIWIASDPFPDKYFITQDGFEVQNGTWISGQPITFLADLLSLGTYEFVISLNDTTGNVSNDTVFVTIRQIDIDSPSNIVYNEGSSSNFIIWNATDGNPDKYSVTRNGSEIETGNWISNAGINISINGLSVGVYSFIITINDTDGNSLPDEVIVTVIDTTNPLSDDPIDITYEMGVSGNQIIWIATDNHPDMYVVTKDGQAYESGNWISSVPINIIIDGLSLGIYTFVITFNDTTNNEITNTVIVTVEDTTTPSIVPPSDFSYEELETGNIIVWDVTDQNPANFTVYRDGLLSQTGDWNNTDNLEINVDGLLLGSYVFELKVEDASGNIISDFVTVSVIELIVPVFDKVPLNLQGNETTIVILSWNVTDAHPGTYDILLNGTSDSTGIWTNADAITVSFGVLTKGYYNFTIIFYDSSLNNVSHTLIYEVTDDLDPLFLLAVQSCSVEEGSNCDLITWWRTQEIYPSQYIIYVNGSADPAISWTDSLISFDVTNFDRGIYNITIVIFDESGNSASATTFATIFDGNLPTFTLPPPNRMTISELSTNNIISWVSNDKYPGFYEIERNGSLLFTDNWQNLNLITINIDGLIIGVYNFTITVFDGSDNSISYTIIVTVIDSTLPNLIEGPTNLQSSEGEDEYTIQWIYSDQNAMNYSIEMNGIELIGLSWISSNPIILNVGDLNLQAGNYNFTIIVWDTTFNVHSNSIFVEIIDDTAPVFTLQPDNYEFYTNQTNQEISWQVFDLHPSSYSVLIDGTLEISNIWDNNEMIILDLNDLEVGSYNITIIISDNSDNKISHSIIIKAKDPLIIETSLPSVKLIEIVHEGDIEYYNGTWLTRFEGLSINNATIQVKLYEDGKLKIIQGSSYVIYTDENGNFDLEFNYTNIPVGNYIWEISFSKNDYESRIVDIPITIIPHSYIIEIQIPAALEKGEDYFITAIVYYANNGTTAGSLSLNQLVSRQGKATGVEVIFNIIISYDDGSSAEVIKKSFTTSKGFAVIQFAGTETQTIKSISHISAAVESNEFGNEFTVALSDADLPLVKVSPSSGIELVTEFILEYISIIILIVITLVSIITVIIYTRKRLNVKIKAHLKTMDNAKVELDALLSIRAIIIQASSGLPLYERKFRSMEVDTTLISGLITAFSAFLGEIGREELFGFETIERQGLSITSHKGFNSRLTIISKNELPMVLLDQISTSHIEIDSKFREQLTSDSGEVLDENFLDQVFEISGLNIGVIEKFELNSRNIRKLKKMKSITRNVKDNINSLKQLFDQNKDEPIYIQNVMEFFGDRGMNEEVSARTFLIAYRYNIINPIFG